MLLLGVVFLGSLLFWVHETFGICGHKVFIQVRVYLANISSNIFSHHLLLELNYTYVRPLKVPPITKALLGPPTLSPLPALYFILHSFYCYDFKVTDIYFVSKIRCIFSFHIFYFHL